MNKFSIASIFSDNCVLQRNKIINIFGYVDSNCEIIATLYDNQHKILSKNTKSICTESEVKWIISLEPQTEQEGCSLKVDCRFTDKINSKATLFENVSIGEVWIAGGQSNMEFELQNCTEGPKELKSKKAGINVRFYYTPKNAWFNDKYYEDEKNSCWKTWDGEAAKNWSAIGYLFAKQLAADVKCTVGVIGCNWGGTSASAWMDEKYLSVDKDLASYLKDQEEAVKGKSIEQQCKEYDDYEVEFAKWNEAFSKLWEERHGITWAEGEKILGKNPWPGPRSCKNPFRPSGLYKTMLNRITPYSSKGVLWYQGESDDHKPKMYAKLFSTMIANWRSDFGDASLPFIFVQLPCNRYLSDKDYKNWCFVREQQMLVHKTIKNAWMAVGIDKGQFNDIHPVSKGDIASRMEKIAVSKVYNQDSKEPVFSPIIKEAVALEDKIIVYFENAEKGFVLRKDEEGLKNYIEAEKLQGNSLPQGFTGFEIAGEDKVYYPAQFTFGKGELANTITLSSDLVQHPVYARYAWYNYGPVTVFAKSGLPLAPFRTKDDDNESATEHASIQQIMTVAN